MLHLASYSEWAEVPPETAVTMKRPNSSPFTVTYPITLQVSSDSLEMSRGINVKKSCPQVLGQEVFRAKGRAGEAPL